MAGALSGVHVLVTRPEKQAGALAARIAAEGGIAIRFPVLQISEVADKSALAALFSRLDEFDWAVFVSPNAVEMAMRLIEPAKWPQRLRCAVVGKSSARLLASYGVTDAVCPKQRFDSEGLLEAPELAQMQGRRVVIFRGNGGRELLGQTLEARGASVEYAECYVREKPELDPAPLRLAFERGELDALTATSSESAQNLLEIAGDWIRAVPLFVPHRRIGEAAAKLGFSQVQVTSGGDDGLVDGMMDWFGKKMHGNG